VLFCVVTLFLLIASYDPAKEYIVFRSTSNEIGMANKTSPYQFKDIFQNYYVNTS